MIVPAVLDAAGRRRSPATMPGYNAGRPPHNKGQLYPADPPSVEEIVAVMRHASDDRHGFRLRALIVVLWRSGLRIQEALALGEHDLDPRRGSLLVRNGSSCDRGSPPASSSRSGLLVFIHVGQAAGGELPGGALQFNANERVGRRRRGEPRREQPRHPVRPRKRRVHS
jgi:site-specific recombinase XerC